MLDEKQFLKEYNLERSFEKAEIAWETLQEIYDNYQNQVYPLMQELSERLTADLVRIKKEVWENQPEKRDG